MAFDFKNLLSSFTKQATASPKRVVGIDIGFSSIKVVEVEETEKALTLRTYGELQLAPYADEPLGSAVTLEPSLLTEALVDVMRESSVEAKDGVLSIPLSASFVTVVPITVKKGESLEGKIRVEARKYIPVPLSDITLDWSEVDSYGDKDAMVHEVLLAAIQNDALERYRSLMSSVKMVSQPSEIEVFSAMRGTLTGTDTTAALIDFGAKSNKLYITNNGMLERIHRVYDGSAASTKRLADIVNVPIEDAEDMKRLYTQDHEHARDIYKTTMSGIERSAQEFKRVIDQFEAKEGKPLGRVVIFGGVTAFPGVRPYLSDALSREVDIANPFERVAYPAFMEDTLNDIGPTFVTALGAALRPFEQTSEAS